MLIYVDADTTFFESRFIYIGSCWNYHGIIGVNRPGHRRRWHYRCRLGGARDGGGRRGCRSRRCRNMGRQLRGS